LANTSHTFDVGDKVVGLEPEPGIE
jgi:hypothetical protein